MLHILRMYRRQIIMRVANAEQVDRGSEKLGIVDLGHFGVGHCLYHKGVRAAGGLGRYTGA